jgi:mycothiol S-conjugate amidase
MLDGYADVAALRTAEQECAARALGLAAVHFLGHRDSGMSGAPDNEHPNALVQAPLEHVAGQLTALIRALRPQVVVTFNSYGGYGHPDHIYLHHAAHAAFAAAPDPARFPEQLTAGLTPFHPSKLYYPTFSTRFLRTAIGAMRVFGRDPRRFGRNNDFDAIRIIEETTPITTTIACGDWLEPNIRARLCHRSQLGGMPPYDRMPRALARRMLGAEHFTRAIPAWIGSSMRERDLFAG